MAASARALSEGRQEYGLADLLAVPPDAPDAEQLPDAEAQEREQPDA